MPIRETALPAEYREKLAFRSSSAAIGERARAAKGIRPVIMVVAAPITTLRVGKTTHTPGGGFHASKTLGTGNRGFLVAASHYFG
jgi:hypothetical protein